MSKGAGAADGSLPGGGGGVVGVRGAQEALQLLNALILAVGGARNRTGNLLAHVLGGGGEVQGVDALGAVGQQDLDLAGGVGGKGTGLIAGVQNQGVVVQALLGGTVGNDVAVAVQDKVVVGVELHAAVVALEHVELIGVVSGVSLVLDVGGVVLSAAHGDGLLLLLVGSIGLHLAGDHLGLGDIVAAAVGDGQNQVALS